MIDYLSRYREDDNGCWLYLGTLNPKGYGQILQTTAHRYFYERLVGPIPVGLHLDHLCRKTQCVNPEHLEPVTPRENARRRSLAMTECPKGHAFTPENTYVRAGRGARECRTCRYDRWVASLGRPVGKVGRPRKQVAS